MKLERIDRQSANLLSELCIKTFKEAYKGVHSEEDIECYCSDNYLPSDVALLLDDETTEAVVALDQEIPAGFYLIKHMPCPVELAGPSTELKQIYVLSSHFGGGLGRQLFDSIVQSALEYGSTRLWLCVSDINYRAQAFYKKLGFSKVGIGPVLVVGKDKLPSSILALEIIK
ncbi:MAG: GNAT family N-acetyltransferase [Kangiellaceae bacterium]|nr:GNAT family N-acetyltransferase [Kangiellaceae bacterium]